MKKLTSILIGLLIVACSSDDTTTPPAPAPVIADGQVLINNHSGNTLYVYNFSFGAPTSTEPILTLASHASDVLDMTPNVTQMRIYFSDQRLSASLEKGVAPDEFNPDVDGDKRFSIAEYYYYPPEYTVDLSFIDSFSFPLTIQFDNPENKGPGGNENVWGIKSISSVIAQLTAQDQPHLKWSNLIWDSNGSFLRIVGPNKILPWTVCPGTALPQFCTFFTQFSPSGTELSPNNLDAWLNSTVQPLSSGYVKGIHAAGLPAQNFETDTVGPILKYGYFTFPMDNANGEFTNLPASIHTTITVYGFES